MESMEPMKSLIAEAEKILAKEPENLWCRIILAQHYATESNYTMAAEHYRKAASVNSQISDPLIGLGKVYYNLAIREMTMRGLTSQSPQTGLINFHPDDRVKDLLIQSKACFERAKGLPSIKQFSPHVGDQGTSNKNFDLFTTYTFGPRECDSFIAMINDKLIHFYFRKGVESEKNNSWDSALSYYENTIEISPNLFYAHFNKASVLFMMGKFNESLKSLDKAIEIKPNLPDALYNREVVRLRLEGISLQQKDKAIKFVTMDLVNANRSNRLGAILVLMWLDKVLCEETLKDRPELVTEFNEIDFSPRSQ
jgi:tetratricopeptide (TPR) repeat protein